MGQEYLPSNTPQQRLQDLMKEYKITQAELASKIGVAESSISRFLNGTKNKLTTEQIIQEEVCQAVPEVKQVVLIQEVSEDLLEQARAILRGEGPARG